MCDMAFNSQKLIGFNSNRNAPNIDFNIWVDLNLKSEVNHLNTNILWGTVFAITVWTLWKARNDRQFNNVMADPNQIAIKSLNLAFETNLIKESATPHNFINWVFPPVGIVKKNTNGSQFRDFGWAAYNKVVRDSQGQQIEGFCGRIGYATPFDAELWGIRHAGRLTSEIGWLEAIIETNSLEAIHLINNNGIDISNHLIRALIQDCKTLMGNSLLDITHTLREGNKCVDYMAKLGQVQGEQLLKVMVPTTELVALLKVDL